MKKIAIATILGLSLAVAAPVAASAETICTDDIVVGLPLEVCLDVPVITLPPLLPPEIPAAPVDPPNQQPVDPALPPVVEPAAPGAPGQPAAPAPATPAEGPSDTPTVGSAEPTKTSPAQEAREHIRNDLLPFVVGLVVLLLLFITGKVVDDVSEVRAKTLDKSEEGV